MEITYIGHSCFKIKGKNATLVVDPYDSNSTGYKLPKMDAEIVLTSHEHPDHNFISGIANTKLVVDGPGEYEANDIYIFGFPTYHDDSKGEERGKNTIYLIEIDGFNILHLGDLGHTLSTETLEKVGSVDVLMIPVGGIYTIDAKKAVKVINDIQPNYVVPMHYQTEDLKLPEKLASLSEFLEEFGSKSGSTSIESLKLTTKLEDPEETQLVILNPTHK